MMRILRGSLQGQRSGFVAPTRRGRCRRLRAWWGAHGTVLGCIKKRFAEDYPLVVLVRPPAPALCRHDVALCVAHVIVEIFKLRKQRAILLGFPGWCPARRAQDLEKVQVGGYETHCTLLHSPTIPRRFR